MSRGVYVRTEEHRRAISKRSFGKKQSEESKRKSRESNIGKKHNISEEAKIKMSYNKGRIFPAEIRKKISEKSKLQKHFLERRIKQSERMKEDNPMRKPEVRRKRSISDKIRWSKISDKDREELFSKVFKSNEIKPNKMEILLDDLIQDIIPNEFKYVGDGQVWIGGKNPDWINTNGKKQLIEFFGNYWHKIEDEKIRKEHFKKYGFDCLIIWEHDLQDKNILLQKVKNF